MYNTPNTHYKYHFIYETTNTKTGKKYIGLHSTNNLDDGYLGSGVRIKRAIKKYGKNCFVRKILEHSATRESLLELETKYVTPEVIEDENFYNISLGGKSYIDSLANIDDSKKFISHQKRAGKIGGRAMYDSMTPEEKKEWHKKGRAASKGTKGCKLPKSPETIKKLSELRKKSKKYTCPLCGRKNLDGGNFKQHLTKVHNKTESEYLEIKTEVYSQ